MTADIVTNQGKAVYIVGPNRLQNELLASFLERDSDLQCFPVIGHAELKSVRSAGQEGHLFLLDCEGKDMEICMEDFAPLFEDYAAAHLLCLFNVREGSGLEANLLSRGVRGFFYLGEPFQMLAKGVETVLNGEFWVSRKLMTDVLKKNNP